MFIIHIFVIYEPCHPILYWALIFMVCGRREVTLCIIVLYYDLIIKVIITVAVDSGVDKSA